ADADDGARHRRAGTAAVGLRRPLHRGRYRACRPAADTGPGQGDDPGRKCGAPVRSEGAGIRIVHTESSLGWGGQEIRILTEARALAARGHQLTLIAPAESMIFSHAGKFGIEAIPMDIARKGPRNLFALKSWFSGNHPDVVNTHSSTDSWLAALSCKAPIVRTRHISAAVGANP